MDSSSSALFSARLFGIKIKISRFLAYFRGFRRFFPQDIVVLYIEIHIYGSRRIPGNDSVDLLIDSVEGYERKMISIELSVEH